MSELEPVPPTRKPLLPVLGAVAAVTALAVAVTLVGSSGGHQPKQLQLAGGSAAATRDAALAAGSSPGGSGYVLVGTLPPGQPDDAPVYDLAKGQAPLAKVAALAHALKAGTPERQADGWRAGGLFVSDAAGQNWWFAPCAADQPVSSDVRVGCAVAGGTVTAEPAPATTPVASSGSGTSGSAGGSAGGSATGEPAPSPVDGATAPPPPSPAPEPDPIPAATVRDAARDVLAAVGLDVAAATIQTSPYGGSATVAPTVGGLTAMGYETRVDVDRDGTIVNANGYLGGATKADTYPLVSAQEAFDALPPQMTTMELCPVDKDGNGCLPPEPMQIMGAHLGLMLQSLAQDELALLPAWLFAVKGWDQPLAAVAVEPQYLEQPEQPRDTPGTTEPGPGVTEPGGTEPNDPGAPAVPPAPPATDKPTSDPGDARTTVGIAEAYRTAKPDEVRIRYYESGSCPCENVTHFSKESSGSVVVYLEADAQPPDRACTADAHAVDVAVALQAALGDRTVYDGSTGKAVTVSPAS